MTGGLVTGRRDVPLAECDPSSTAGLLKLVGDVDQVISSPAQRCVKTAKALFPNFSIESDSRLWEQGFGAWEGRAYADIPDLSPLEPEALARHRPPEGESFVDVCERVAPAILDHAPGPATKTQRRIAIVAHAGSIRAALALAFGRRPEAALSFEIAHLSATRIRVFDGPAFAIGYVNRLA